MSDNWKHRNKGMKCRTCMWFVGKERFECSEEQKPGTLGLCSGTLGRCRRHAPTMNGYPGVFEEDWCGDHKLDENKI